MLQVGSVVGYQSDSRGLVRAVVTRGPHADGTWDLDIKEHVPLHRIRVQPSAPSHAQGPGAHMSAAGTATSLATQDNYPSAANAPKPPGTVCFYKSSSRGWIPARVQRFNAEHGAYDLDCKECARLDSIFFIEAGALMEYYSPSQNRWVPSRVLRPGRQPGTFDLECREGAEVQRMRPSDKAMEDPPTYTAMPGMLCYEGQGGADAPAQMQQMPQVPETISVSAITTEHRDKDMIYENHSTQMRLRPRSKTPERRPKSVEELQVEDEVRTHIARAIASRDPQVIQEAIKHANSLGVNSGPDIGAAIHALRGMGGRLERTASVPDIRADSPAVSEPASGILGCSAAAQRKSREWAAASQQQNQQPHGHQNQRQHSQEEPGLLTNMIGPKPTPDAGVVTRMLGPKPTEDAGLLTRVLGPKPRENSGILERVFGADHGLFGAPIEQVPLYGEDDEEEWAQAPPSFANMGMQGGVQHRPLSQAMSVGTDPQLHHVNPGSAHPGYDANSGAPSLGNYGRPPTDPTWGPVPAPASYGGGLPPPGSYGGPPTDARLPSHGPPAPNPYDSYAQQRPHPGPGAYGGSSGGSLPPTDPQMRPGSRSGYGAFAQPPTDPQLHGHAHQQHNDSHMPFMSVQAPGTDPQMHSRVAGARIS